MAKKSGFGSWLWSTFRLVTYLEKDSQKRKKQKEREEKRYREAVRRAQRTQQSYQQPMPQMYITIEPKEEDDLKKYEVIDQRINQLIDDGFLSRDVVDDKINEEFENQFDAWEIDERVDNFNVNWKKHALIKAMEYSNSGVLSKGELYSQLHFDDKFTEEETNYAITQLKVDWNTVALQKVKEYVPDYLVSKTQLLEELSYHLERNFDKAEVEEVLKHIDDIWLESMVKVARNDAINIGFTKKDYINSISFSHLTNEETQLLLSHMEDVWGINAMNYVKEYLQLQPYSKKTLYDFVCGKYSPKFTKEEVEYALEHLNVNWNEEALRAAKHVSKDEDMTKKEIYAYLVEDEYFTKQEADYAMSHLDIDWNKVVLNRAKEYILDYGEGMSKEEQIESLVDELSYYFEEEEIDYAIKHLDNVL